MRYVYGFTKGGRKTDFGPIGLLGNGEQVYALPEDGLAAVVSETTEDAIALLPKEQLAERLARHQSVVESVMRSGQTVLPMKFGTMLADETQVSTLLRDNRRRLHGLLDEIEGLFEVEVIVTWPDVQQVFAEIAGEEEVEEMKRRIAELPPGESQSQRVALGKMVKERLEEKKRALQERIVPPLRQAARKTVRHAIRNDPVVVNAAFLVDRAARYKLEALVRETDRWEDGRLNFRIVGPLPPYSFSTVQVQRAELAELDEARRQLDLPERITVEQVADAARSAMRRYHPDADSGDEELPQKFERAKAAADLLKRFCPPEGLDLSHCERRELLHIELREEM
jgi:hypothetical protein